MKYIFLILFALLFHSSYAQEGTPDVIRGDKNFEFVINVNEFKSPKGVDGVEVYLYKTKSDDLLESQTTEMGTASFMIDPKTEYEIRTCHTGYFKNGMSIYECNEGDEVLCTFGATDYAFVAGGGKGKPNAVLMATLELKPLAIGSITELENVYYDLDKANLREDGKSELDDLIAIMIRNKSIKIELSSHTDSRASVDYNQDLSERRAQSCFDYMVSKGINPSRVRPVGYGESKLVNHCKDGIDCEESQHQKNRRTEVEILAYEPIVCQPSTEVDFKIKDLKNDKNDKL